MSDVSYPNLGSANAVYLQSTIQVDTTGSLVLSANNSIRYLLVMNKGSNSIALKVNSIPDTGAANEGIIIPAGGNYEPLIPPANNLYLRSLSGTQTIELVWG